MSHRVTYSRKTRNWPWLLGMALVAMGVTVWIGIASADQESAPNPTSPEIVVTPDLTQPSTGIHSTLNM